MMYGRWAPQPYPHLHSSKPRNRKLHSSFWTSFSTLSCIRTSDSEQLRMPPEWCIFINVLEKTKVTRSSFRHFAHTRNDSAFEREWSGSNSRNYLEYLEFWRVLSLVLGQCDVSSNHISISWRIINAVCCGSWKMILVVRIIPYLNINYEVLKKWGSLCGTYRNLLEENNFYSILSISSS